MEEAGDLLEDSWFFGNLLNTKTKTISRSYSDLSFSSCPSSCSTQDDKAKNKQKDSSVSSRKQLPVTPTSLTRTPSLPNSMETQSFVTKNPDPSPNYTPFLARNDKKDGIVKNEPKSSSLSSRKQPPVALSSPTKTPTQSFHTKKPDPNLARSPSMSASIGEINQEDEEDQESEFSLGRLIRQASMNSSHTSNPPRQTSKALAIENTRRKLEFDQEKIIDVRKIERKQRQNRKNNGKNKNGGGAPAIPGGWVDKSSSEDMKAHIKFWARAVASNVRQECS
ncbi:uncharacterized protein LOC143560271 [Bidens hawaiensis]|uniref:uncharacterized protein LOC143560271 n=1 Tax=Bidens hawaiensis TaxID=980011 RepID=UPI00404A4880